MHRMGGDRDGNPFVTPETTREVVLTARMAAISEYERSVEKLMYELSVWRCNDELQVCDLPGFLSVCASPRNMMELLCGWRGSCTGCPCGAARQAAGAP